MPAHRTLAAATVAALAVASACTTHAPSGGAPSASAAASAPSMGAEAGAPSLHAAVREGSTIARSPSSDVLVVADEDHAALHLLAMPLGPTPENKGIELPGRPAQVLVTADRVIASVRWIEKDATGAVLVFKRKGAAGLEETARIKVPGDAWGLALSPDESLVLVSSAWTHQVSAIDLASAKVLWSVDVAREPRGITILPSGDRAYVSHLIGSAVTRIDDLRGASPAVKRVELPAAPLRSPAGTKLPASNGWAVTASPEGDRVFFPRHALGGLGPTAWFGVASIDVLRTARDEALAPPRLASPPSTFVPEITEAMKQVRYLDGALPVAERSEQLAEPRAIVYRKRTHTLLVASEGTSALVEYDALGVDPTLAGTRSYTVSRKGDKFLGVAEQGGAPSGIALSEDEREAYVYCRSTYDVAVVALAPGPGRWGILPPRSISVAEDKASKDVSVGRRYFYQAQGVPSQGVSCNGCHPEGRDDGHVWHETTQQPTGDSHPPAFSNFLGGSDLSVFRARWDLDVDDVRAVGYARQTPMIAGRVKARGPYGWHAESPDLPSRLIAGFHLHRWDKGDADENNERAAAGYLASFIREGLVPPPRAERALTEEEQRGKAIFESPRAQCATCHAPASEYTDRAPVPLAELPPRAGFAADPNHAYKTPSLLYVGGTAPYFHDGRFESLESLIENNADRMGKTAHLSPDERKALVAFLKTL